MKTAKLVTPLQPHQQRVIDKLRASGGLLVAHGVGSGKTLSSIAAADALGLPLEVIAPAPLVENYNKELKKHLDEPPEAGARIRSYEKAVRDKDVNLDALAIMDEAHRARNTGTQISKDVASQVAKARARLLLTGTPVYNSASDLAPLLNTAAGRKLLPDDPMLFKKTFVGEKTVQAPFLTRMKGRLLGHPIEDVKFPALINRERLIQAAKGYVDVHRGGGEHFPDRIDEEHDVDLSPKQMEAYKFHEGSMPWYLKAKIRAGLPLDKQESKDLNAFQGALRQVSNTPRPYMKHLTDDEEIAHTPKINKMVEHLQKMHKDDPNFRGVVYSNYLDAGVLPMSRALNKAGIPHNVFTGEVSKEKRDQMVRDYNSGKIPVLLLSGAGSEGLDLKGTKAIQIMEPHWNESRLDQVIGRGIRYKSHEHLPAEERKVRVMRYNATLPKDLGDWAGKLIGEKPKQSIEQYLRNMSNQKAEISRQIADALQEASDAGPLKKAAAYTLNDEKLKALLDSMGVTAERKGRKDVLMYAHPAGMSLRSPYDRSFMEKKIRDEFGGDQQEYATQIQNDLLNAGYAALGDVTKKNQVRQSQRAATGAGYGALVGSVLSPLPQIAVTLGLYEQFRKRGMNHDAAERLAGVFGITAGLSTPVLAGTAGWHLGKATYKPLSADAMVANHTHPLLMPPKEVKQKTRLELKE
jgi:superfamily II DNA or RNA helicase